MRLLIVGGVAGGASCATRARRLSEDIEIIVFERGPYISFANCGLPYYVGGIIQEESKLFAATPAFLKRRFGIDVRTETEVLKIDRAKNTIEVRDLKTGNISCEIYDALLLSPGAQPLIPALPGADLPGVFTLRSVPDSRAIKIWISERKAQQAVIVGAGFIGLEMAENFVSLGIKTTMIEMLPQVMPSMDPEMAAFVHEHLQVKGVTLMTNDAVTAFDKQPDGKLIVRTRSGKSVPADLVLLAVGVRAETNLARAAGLELGEKGGIRVDAQMRTSDPKIWAVGDAVEVCDFITGEFGMVPLAGPANRQGRIAADAILGRPSEFRGIQGSAVCQVFDLTAASTGVTEKTLKKLGLLYDKIYSHPGHHAGYYPGAETIHFKLIFSSEDGRVLGAQAVGEQGVEKRIDVIAMAIQKGATVYDLEEAELCYAPQFGSAKDPVNILGMIAANILRGDSASARWEDLGGTQALILDVRTSEEFEAGHVEGAVNVPVDALRSRIKDLPHNREIWTYCGVGLRGYFATRILRQRGFDARNLSGGYQTYRALKFSGF